MKRIVAVLVAVVSLVLVLPNAFAVTLYGTAYDGSSGPATLYTIDPSTGLGTPIGIGTGYNRVGAIDFDPLNGMLYGIGTDGMSGAVDLITINTTTGAGTAVGGTGISDTFQDISFASNGTLFGVSAGQAYTINTATGVATALPNPTGLGKNGSGLAFDSSNTLYNINAAVIGTIDPTTGIGTATGVTVNYPVDLFNPRANAMDYDLTSGILYASVVHSLEGDAPDGIGPILASNFIAQIDVATGNVTNVFATVPGLDGLAVQPVLNNSVPDSLSTIWLALPVCGLFVLARRRSSVRPL